MGSSQELENKFKVNFGQFFWGGVGLMTSPCTGLMAIWGVHAGKEASATDLIVAGALAVIPPVVSLGAMIKGELGLRTWERLNRQNGAVDLQPVPR